MGIQIAIWITCGAVRHYRSPNPFWCDQRCTSAAITLHIQSQLGGNGEENHSPSPALHSFLIVLYQSSGKPKAGCYWTTVPISPQDSRYRWAGLIHMKGLFFVKLMALIQEPATLKHFVSQQGELATFHYSWPNLSPQVAARVASKFRRRRGDK